MKLAGRLLVVEQEEQVRKLMRSVLVQSGYEVQIARTAEEALEKMSASSGFDAVLSEAALPGMNGHELAWHLAARYPSTKIIFITASHVDCGVCPHALKCPSIAKPFAPKELVKRLAEILTDDSRRAN